MSINPGDKAILSNGIVSRAVTPTAGIPGLSLSGHTSKATAPKADERVKVYPNKGGGFLVYKDTNWKLIYNIDPDPWLLYDPRMVDMKYIIGTDLDGEDIAGKVKFLLVYTNNSYYDSFGYLNIDDETVTINTHIDFGGDYTVPFSHFINPSVGDYRVYPEDSETDNYDVLISTPVYARYGAYYDAYNNIRVDVTNSYYAFQDAKGAWSGEALGAFATISNGDTLYWYADGGSTKTTLTTGVSGGKSAIFWDGEWYCACVKDGYYAVGKGADPSVAFTWTNIIAATGGNCYFVYNADIIYLVMQGSTSSTYHPIIYSSEDGANWVRFNDIPQNWSDPTVQKNAMIIKNASLLSNGKPMVFGVTRHDYVNGDNQWDEMSILDYSGTTRPNKDVAAWTETYQEWAPATGILDPVKNIAYMVGFKDPDAYSLLNAVYCKHL